MIMIYCVEDDREIRDLVVYALHSSGFEAKGFENGDELFSAIQDKLPRLILLDIMLHGEDGVTILKKLKSRSSTAHVPVIMASAKGTEFDKISCLDLGADDYLAKPFGIMEMVSRIRAVLRRTQNDTSSKVYSNGKLELDPIAHTVFASKRSIDLTLKEFEILRLLISNLGKVFTREQLLDRIWGIHYTGETRTVDVHIGTLRSKLADCADYIQTVRGVGYRMEVK